MKFLTSLAAVVFLTPMVVGADGPKKATFAAGCFWCMEAIYDRVPGVTDVVSGYAGGSEQNPTYEQVGGGKTGHCEAIEITYDPEKTSYEKLLEVFWKSHDATNGRGVAPDFGKQYRSALYYRTSEDKSTIEASRSVIEKRLGKKIATEVAELKRFWPAEAYHQDYVKLHPKDSYVRNVSIPRLIETGFKE